jgi:hypothetical protein
MPTDDSTTTQEVIKDDNKTSFLETALKVIKNGVYIIGGMWIAAGVGKVAIDIAYGGTVDTSFLESAWNSLLPVFTGTIGTFIGFFIAKKSVE